MTRQLRLATRAAAGTDIDRVREQERPPNRDSKANTAALASTL